MCLVGVLRKFSSFSESGGEVLEESAPFGCREIAAAPSRWQEKAGNAEGGGDTAETAWGGDSV